MAGGADIYVYMESTLDARRRRIRIGRSRRTEQSGKCVLVCLCVFEDVMTRTRTFGGVLNVKESEHDLEHDPQTVKIYN